MNRDAPEQRIKEQKGALEQRIENIAKINSMVVKYNGDREAIMKGLKIENFGNESQRIAVNASLRRSYRDWKAIVDAPKVIQRQEETIREREFALRMKRLEVVGKLLDFLTELFRRIRP